MVLTVGRKHCQGAITVGYGHDEITGYFISVSDSRLAYDEEGTEELNHFLEEATSGGTGFYLQAHTGTIGLGQRVNLDVMEKLWKLYGVSEEGMAILIERRGHGGL